MGLISFAGFFFCLADGSSGSDKNYSESEPRPKAATTAAAAARRDAPARPSKSPSVPASAPPPNVYFLKFSNFCLAFDEMSGNSKQIGLLLWYQGLAAA